MLGSSSPVNRETSCRNLSISYLLDCINSNLESRISFNSVRRRTISSINSSLLFTSNKRRDDTLGNSIFIISFSCVVMSFETISVGFVVMFVIVVFVVRGDVVGEVVFVMFENVPTKFSVAIGLVDLCYE